MGDFLFDEFQPFHFYHDSTVDYVIPEDGVRETYIGKYLSLSFYYLLNCNKQKKYIT